MSKKTELTEAEYRRKIKEVEEMKQMMTLQHGLPHLFGYPMYKWQREIFESKEREIFLTSANQVGKSSIAIRKNIHLATSPKLWTKYWPNLLPGQVPGLFWYFYPTQGLATTEVEEKWVKEYLPRNEFKDHPQFGWKLEYHKGEIHAVVFNTGVTIQFKSYSQRVKDLQGSSVYHLTCDEELPVEYLPELSARLNATNGYFLHVFTATLGQLHWKQTMEPSTPKEEKHVGALKIRVSLYDSMEYEDGSPSPWTEQKIKRAIANCPTEAEVQRRIFGRFVMSSGLMYEGFSLEKNMCEGHMYPKSWSYYGAVDPGSGGKSGHPTGMIIIAVNPNATEGRVIRAWRGDGIPTTSEDILLKWKELKHGLKLTQQMYDYSAKDFFMIATRAGEAFNQADKGREAGVGLLNTLFKAGMLKIHRGDPELEKLVQELTSLSTKTKKTVAADDLIDALRYACMAVPWNFEDIQLSGDEKKAKKKKAEEIRVLSNSEQRRLWILETDDRNLKNRDEDGMSPEDELDQWSSLY